MQVSIYHKVSRTEYKLYESFDCRNLQEARELVLLWFQLETNNAQFNIKYAYMSECYLEAHIYGYCRDEATAIVLEDESYNFLDKEASDGLE